MTTQELSYGIGLWPLIPRCKFLSGWPLQYRAAGQFWPSSYAFWKSNNLPQECNPTTFWHLMVISPHGLGAVVNPHELSLRPEAALALATGSLYLLPVLLVDSSDNYLIYVQTCETVPRGWIHFRVGCILSAHILVGWGPTVVGIALTVLIPSTPHGSHHRTIIRIIGGFGWTGRGTGKFLPWWFRAGLCLRYQFGCVFISLCRAVLPNTASTSTSWE